MKSYKSKVFILTNLKNRGFDLSKIMTEKDFLLKEELKKETDFFKRTFFICMILNDLLEQEKEAKESLALGSSRNLTNYDFERFESEFNEFSLWKILFT